MPPAPGPRSWRRPTSREKRHWLQESRSPGDCALPRCAFQKGRARARKQTPQPPKVAGRPKRPLRRKRMPPPGLEGSTAAMGGSRRSSLLVVEANPGQCFQNPTLVDRSVRGPEPRAFRLEPHVVPLAQQATRHRGCFDASPLQPASREVGLEPEDEGVAFLLLALGPEEFSGAGALDP